MPTPNKLRLFVNHFCEISHLLGPWTTDQFYGVDQIDIEPGAVYVVGREQCRLFPDRIREMAQQATVVFSNPAEGSETFLAHLRYYGLHDLATSGALRCIVGGDIGPGFKSIKYNHFLAEVFRYDENVAAAETTDRIFDPVPKPYQFLFLNGRARWHRDWLIKQFQQQGILDSALWTSLHGDVIHYLPPQYEVDQFAANVDRPCSDGFVKNQLFNNLWGEIYIKPDPYWDTYFSVVTETVFDAPWSFFTEKIAKPLAMGHPFVVAANAGFYRDLRDLGFQTFDPIIDESFDTIQDSAARLARVRDVVVDLCGQDLVKLLQECRAICKYNQQHLRELSQTIPRDFPDQFFQLIND